MKYRFYLDRPYNFYLDAHVPQVIAVTDRPIDADWIWAAASDTLEPNSKVHRVAMSYIYIGRHEEISEEEARKIHPEMFKFVDQEVSKEEEKYLYYPMRRVT